MINSRNKYKKEAYEQAMAFRKRGFTYTEIAKICDVSRGTVSNWLKDEDFSKQVATTNKKRAYKENVERIKLVNKTRKAERNTHYQAVLRLAETEYKNYAPSPLFIAGLTIYLCNGDQKNSNLIRLTSNKPELHRIFIRFAITYLGVDKSSIRFWLLLYKDQDEIKNMKHWSRKISLSIGQFYRNQIIDNKNKQKTLHFGSGNTIIGSTLLKKKLQYWVDLTSKGLQKNK